MSIIKNMKLKSWDKLQTTTKGGIMGLIVGGIMFGLVYNLGFVYSMILGWPFMIFYAVAGMLILNQTVAMIVFTLGILLNMLYLFFVGVLLSKLFRKKEINSIPRKMRNIFFILIILIFVVFIGFSTFESYKIGTDKEYAIIKCEEAGHCLNRVSAHFSDPSICEMIQDSSIQGYCYEWRANQLNDELLCDKINDKLSRKVNCFTRVGFNQKDSSICEKFENNNLIAFCSCRVENYASGSNIKLPKCNNLSVCEDLEDLDIKDDCYAEVAFEKKDSLVCSKIYNQTSKDSCYYQIGTKTGDTSICEDIEQGVTRRACEQGGFKY